MTIRLLSFVLFCVSLVRGVEPPVGVVSHIKILSENVPDLSSIEAWKKAVIKDGMTDREKAMAVWRSVVAFQHQETPPVEFLQVENNVQDPIKMANVYGYSLCSVASAHVQALARAAGLQARGWTINRHTVSEVMWDGKWHLLDSSLINFVPKADGDLAGVEEIVAGIKDWYTGHPGFKGNDSKLSAFMRGGGWRKGPDILSRDPHYDDNGWLPAATHGWYSTMQEFDGSTLFQSECGYSTGYELNVQLRPGERLIRNWSNKGLHVNMDGGGGTPGCLAATTGKDSLRYTPKFGDLAPGRIGNGVLEWEVPVGSVNLALAALRYENLGVRKSPALAVLENGSPGILELRMPCSYVYLSGALNMDTEIRNGGCIAIEFSDNNGLDWKPVKTLTGGGSEKIELKPLAFRRYDYRLRFTMQGAGTGLNALRLTHDIQHSQRPLPALVKGENVITFQTGPAEGTITLEGSTDLTNKSKQLVFTDFHPVFDKCEPGAIRPQGRDGSLTFPVRTPGDIARLRIHSFYRCRDAKDAWDVQVSFDEGKTFRTAVKLAGPAVMMGQAVTVRDVPPHARNALVRYSGTQVNTAAILNFRIDADYLEPSGGFAQVKIIYVWEENGAEKRSEHVAVNSSETFRIQCAGEPVMKSLAVELAK